MKLNSYKAFLLVSNFIVLATMSGCSMMLPDRSFLDEMEREESFYNPGHDFPVVAGDTGEVRRSREEIMKRTPASERQKRMTAESLSISEELAGKEAALEEEETRVYNQDKKYLPSDSDKLYYLSLYGSERERYIQTKKQDIKDEMDNKRNMVQRHSVHSAELYLGMDKSEVVEIWGKPARVEVAGNPNLQNERWSFIEDGSVKQVYFEEGRVQGWALDL